MDPGGRKGPGPRGGRAGGAAVLKGLKPMAGTKKGRGAAAARLAAARRGPTGGLLGRPHALQAGPGE